MAVAFAVTVWGASFVAARHLLEPGSLDRTALDPLTLAAARFAIASLIFAAPFAVALIRRTISGRDLIRMALLGQIGFSTYFWLQYTGVKHTNAGVASVLVVGLFPSATAVLAPLFGERKLSGRAWAALLLGFVGVAILAMERPGQGSGRGRFLVGAACCVANAFGFAVYSLLSRRWMKSVAPLTMTAGAMILGTLGLLAFSLVKGGSGWSSMKSLDATQWGALAFLSVFCSVFGYFAWNFALTRIEASRAAVWIYTEPVIAMGLALVLLGERYGWPAIAGVTAIALSVVVVSRRP